MNEHLLDTGVLHMDVLVILQCKTLGLNSVSWNKRCSLGGGWDALPSAFGLQVCPLPGSFNGSKRGG
eukprot:2392003-Amphidinium_carterae.1